MDVLDSEALRTLLHGESRTVPSTVHAHASRGKIPDGGFMAAVFHLPLPKHGKRR
jgi:hypothetical protein